MNRFKRIDYAEILDNRERKKNSKGTLMKLCPEARLDFNQNDNDEYLYDLNIRDRKAVNWTCHICGYKRHTSVTRRVEKINGIYRMKMCNICKNDPNFPYKEVYPTIYASIDTERTTTSFYKLTREDSIYVIGKDTTVKIVNFANLLKKKIKNCKELTPKNLENSIANKYPDSIKEWSPNNTASPYEVTYGSRTKRLWICDKGHDYPMSPKDKFIRHFRCPVCHPYGTRFIDEFPQYIEYYSPNNTIPIEELVKCDKRSTLWICKNGHEQPKTCEKIAYEGLLCRKCYEESIMENTQHLTDVYPQIRNIWDYEKNDKTPDVIPLSSRDTFYFKCSFGHEYPNEIRAVLNNSCECLVCTNKKVVAGYNDFKSRYPELAEKLSPELQKVADRIFGAESKYLKWICSICGGEYSDAVGNMLKGINNCPYCAGKKAMSGFNDIKTLHPELVERLSSELRNIAEDIVAKDEKVLSWECPNCRGDYYDMIGNLAKGIDNCPYCNNKKVLEGFNDLASIHPELMEKLTSQLRQVANKIICKDEKYLTWICPTCHGEYSDSIGNILNGIDNCPYCNNKKVLSGFNDLATRNPDLVDEAYLVGNYMIGTDLSKSKNDSNKLAYWICQDCKHIYPMKIADRVLKDERGHNPCPRCNYISKKKIFIF